MIPIWSAAGSVVHMAHVDHRLMVQWLIGSRGPVVHPWFTGPRGSLVHGSSMNQWFIALVHRWFTLVQIRMAMDRFM